MEAKAGMMEPTKGTKEKRLFTLEACNSARAYEIRFQEPFDLQKLENSLSKNYDILASNSVMLMVNIDNSSVTIYSSGKIMIKHITKEKAHEIAEKIVDFL